MPPSLQLLRPAQPPRFHRSNLEKATAHREAAHRRAKEYGQRGFDFMLAKRYADAAEMFFRALGAGPSGVAYRDFLDPWKVEELEGALFRAREMVAMTGQAEQQQWRQRTTAAQAEAAAASWQPRLEADRAAVDPVLAEVAAAEAARREAEARALERLRTAEAAAVAEAAEREAAYRASDEVRREARRRAAADRATQARARAEALMAERRYGPAELVLDAVLMKSPTGG